MTLNDSVILEFFDEKDLELPPKALYRNLNRHGHDIGYSTVQLRLSELLENGFVEKDKNGFYEISDQGEKWLRGELDESELDEGE